MVLNEKFKIEQAMKGNTRTIMFRGAIDEDAAFNAILKINGPLVFNFRGVTMINSCGVRNWVLFMKQLAGRPVYYEECPPVIVRQLNMVPSFVGHAKVVSVFGAYICDDCEHEKLVLMKHDQFKGDTSHLEENLKCDSCGKGEMEFDGHPDQYFAFAK